MRHSDLRVSCGETPSNILLNKLDNGYVYTRFVYGHWIMYCYFVDMARINWGAYAIVSTVRGRFEFTPLSTVNNESYAICSLRAYNHKQ